MSFRTEFQVWSTIVLKLILIIAVVVGISAAILGVAHGQDVAPLPPWTSGERVVSVNPATLEDGQQLPPLVYERDSYVSVEFEYGSPNHLHLANRTGGIGLVGNHYERDRGVEVYQLHIRKSGQATFEYTTPLGTKRFTLLFVATGPSTAPKFHASFYTYNAYTKSLPRLDPEHNHAFTYPESYCPVLVPKSLVPELERRYGQQVMECND